MLKGATVSKTAILQLMTEMLGAVIGKLAILPAAEQDRIARWLLQELPDEELWEKRFFETQDALSKLAAETRNQLATGQATDLDPAKM
jgi:hypothetical protein